MTESIDSRPLSATTAFNRMRPLCAVPSYEQFLVVVRATALGEAEVTLPAVST